MKKLGFFLSIMLLMLLTACTTNEDKANKLIKQYMFESLYDYKSYEPTKTIVDTLENEIAFNDEALNYAQIGIEKTIEFQNLENELKRAEDEMNLAASIFGKSSINFPYKKAKQEYDDAQVLMNKTQIEILECIYNILTINEDIELNHSNEILGWKVTHKYRCNNRGGNVALGEEIFLIDIDFNEIIKVYEMDDYFVKATFINQLLKQGLNKDDILDRIEEYKK